MFLSIPGSGPGSLLLGRAVIHVALFPQGPASQGLPTCPLGPSPLLAGAAGLPASLTVDVHETDGTGPMGCQSPLVDLVWENLGGS